jgi:transposase
LDILSAYAELGSFRATAALCGTTHKTVRRVVERRTQPSEERPPRPKSTDPLVDLIAEKIRATDGRISAKRLLPLCRAEGYGGSDRHLRRAVAAAKATWRKERRTDRPWQPVPGEHLVIDWGVEAGLHVFCAVLAWSRTRFVRFAAREDQPTTLRPLAECFETLGGVPAVVLADRMGCLKGGVVANVVVPAPGYVAFAAHYGFSPDFCEAADPESKGMVEWLVGYAKRDLLTPAGGWPTLEAANEAAVAWCAEVNARSHSEIAAVPDVRLATGRSVLRPLPSLRPAIAPTASRKVDRLRTVRYGSARYSVPGHYIGRRVELAVLAGELVIAHGGAEIARHRVVGPGEMSLEDAHYGRPPRTPVRAVRPRSQAEIAFCSLRSGGHRLPAGCGGLGDEPPGPRARRHRGARAGVWPRVAPRRPGAGARLPPLRRRRRPGDPGRRDRDPAVRPAGARLALELPRVPVRPLAAYALEPGR